MGKNVNFLLLLSNFCTAFTNILWSQAQQNLQIALQELDFINLADWTIYMVNIWVSRREFEVTIYITYQGTCHMWSR